MRWCPNLRLFFSGFSECSFFCGCGTASLRIKEPRLPSGARGQARLVVCGKRLPRVAPRSGTTAGLVCVTLPGLGEGGSVAQFSRACAPNAPLDAAAPVTPLDIPKDRKFI